MLMNIIIIGISYSKISSLIYSLHSRLALKDLRHLHYFFGIEATWTVDATLHLSQI